MKNKRFIVLFCICICFVFTSCFNDYEYQGDYPALQTMAVNSILGVSGGYSDVVKVEEVDEYGRLLFYFESSAIMEYTKISAYLIAQKYDEEYVYYYPDYNFIIAPTAEELTEEKITELKNKNDWGAEMNMDRCIKKSIQSVKPDFDPWKVSVVPERQLDKAFEIINQNKTYDYYTAIYLTSDFYNRHIYMFAAVTDEKSRDAYAVLFDLMDSAENKIHIFKLSDCYNYQDELKAFKEENGWETPRE